MNRSPMSRLSESFSLGSMSPATSVLTRRRRVCTSVRLVPIMSLAHMQRHGHRPIALVGGGTALIGDPSGKTEMRQILTREQIDHNACCLQKQLSRYLDFGEGKAILAQQCRLAHPAQLYRISPGYRAAFQCQQDAGRRKLSDPPGKGSQFHRVQLHAPAGL